MLRICLICNRQYHGSPGSVKCPDCVAHARATTLGTRTCKTCGVSFLGGPRAWYCPDCRAERKKAQSRAAKQRGPARPLGSVDTCTRCGKLYTVASGRQRYCKDCAQEACKAVDRKQGMDWYTSNRDTVKRRENRHKAAASINCVVCGKSFIPVDASITCSSECSRVRKNENWRAAYHKRKNPTKEK